MVVREREREKEIVSEREREREYELGESQIDSMEMVVGDDICIALILGQDFH